MQILLLTLLSLALNYVLCVMLFKAKTDNENLKSVITKKDHFFHKLTDLVWDHGRFADDQGYSMNTSDRKTITYNSKQVEERWNKFNHLISGYKNSLKK